MGQRRGSKRKVITVSSEEASDSYEVEENSKALQGDEDFSEAEKQGDGKLKSTAKAKGTRLRTTDASTQDRSSQKSPAKSKLTKVNGKVGGKESKKPNVKPIYSFFNAATQRQQLCEPLQKSSTASRPGDAIETIQDSSEDDVCASVSISKDSSTALAMRKRKVHNGSGPAGEIGQAPSVAPKFRKTFDGSRSPSFQVLNEDKRPWTEQFAPVDITELAVHKRKVADVRQWLENAVSSKRQQVLILKGPAGVGKTSTIILLAKEMGFNVSEWRDSSDSEFGSDSNTSTSNQFEDYLRRASRSTGLELSNDNAMDGLGGSYRASVQHRKQLLLIEEFPNTFSRLSSTLRSFRSAILQYVSSPPVQSGDPTPIVMVISETLLSTNTAAADSFTAHRLLGPELINHPYINTIEFNPVATTILTKALQNIIVKEARKSGRRMAPGLVVLRRLAEVGDIRSAVSSLELLCLRGNGDDTWSSKISFTKPKKCKSEQGITPLEEEALKLICSRESNLGMFHAVGRVVHNKRREPVFSSSIAQPPPWLPQHRRAMVPEIIVDSLIDELGTDTPTFLAALHENYTLSCSCTNTENMLDSICGCLENISDADLLSIDRLSFGNRAYSGSAIDGFRQDEMSFQVAVRGVQFRLPHPVHRGPLPGASKGASYQMFYPRSLKLWKKEEEVEGVLSLLTERAQYGAFNQSIRIQLKQKPLADGGVETWRRNIALNRSSNEINDEIKKYGNARCNISRSDMRLERLPYMVRILKNTEGLLLDQIWSVSSLYHSPPIIGTDMENDEDIAEKASELNIFPEPWTTDLPDRDALLGNKKIHGPLKSEFNRDTEFGLLGMPVESRIDSLVLQDDDIVDE
ncbi:hypothetical protein M433DRAFT_159752 [Acidomyces richmondensis BFW]|nr:hypothetical protein M433DRAFT_159752 [Acidomyces richmondensis BFW]